jgi:glucan-binding YG repeat protein
LADGRLVNYDSQGKMYHGEAKINGKWYYFDATSGKTAQCWYKLPDGRTVYYDVDNDGNGQGMLHGMQEINGKYYYFNIGYGTQQAGVVYNTTTQKLQYYGAIGGALSTNTTIKSGSNVYVVDGNGNIVLKNGENDINGNWYYYNESTGKVVIGWYKLSDGRTVYYDSSTAQMVHGEKNLNDSWYYFDGTNGAETVSKFISLGDGRTVYYDEQGHMVHGEEQLNGNWYYFDQVTGAEAISTFIKLNDGRTVYYDGQGHMVKGWQNINNNTYYFDLVTGAMYTGTHYIDGTKHTFGSDGVEDTWGWLFPADGRGHFTGAQLFGVNAGGEFRLNGFHDGLDFGSIDHPGYEVHAVHKGIVTGIGYASGLDWYVLIDTGEYLTVYQEAFSSRSNIWVSVGQQVNVGDVIGGRTTAHLHLGITRQKNFNVALANSFNNNGTWINPCSIVVK